MILRVGTFTAQGEALVHQILGEWQEIIPQYRDKEIPLEQWTGECFTKRLPILFVGACGIAVRAIAPFVKDKLSDSAVLVMDERGQYVIPLLSGHMGGANELAMQIAKRAGATPVLTTATDVEGLFSVDVFAKENGLRIMNREGIREVSAKLLRGELVTITWDTDVTYSWNHKGRVDQCLRYQKQEDKISKNQEQEHRTHRNKIYENENQENRDYVIQNEGKQTGDDETGMPTGLRFVPFETKDVDIRIITKKSFGQMDGMTQKLLLLAKEFVLGIGCKKGKSFSELDAFLKEHVPWKLEDEIYAIASIDLKAREEGLWELAQYYHIPFRTYSAQALEGVEGDFSESGFVREKTGVGNVCERAAMYAAGDGGTLLQKKVAADGMTVAVVQRKPVIHFT